MLLKVWLEAEVSPGAALVGKQTLRPRSDLLSWELHLHKTPQVICVLLLFEEDQARRFWLRGPEGLSLHSESFALDFSPVSAEGGNHHYRLGLEFSTHKLQLVSIGGWGTGWDNGRGCVWEEMALR